MNMKNVDDLTIESLIEGSDEISRDKYPIILISNKINGIETHHTWLMKVRYIASWLESTRCHKYLNLYNRQESHRWNSCIECDNISFNPDKYTLTYHSSTTTMVYQFVADSGFNRILRLFDEMSGT